MLHIKNDVDFTHDGALGIISSAENMKGVNAVQRCSVEAQKGHCRHRLCTAIAPFWFSTEHL